MKVRLPIYTIMHFLVDLTCIYRLYTLVMPMSGGYENWLIMVVLYNFLAFALPGLIGLIADNMNVSESMAAVGCVLTALPVFLTGFPIITVILQGIGNGLFHVGAGRSILEKAHGKYTHSGIFVCSGAMGVFFGTVWRNNYMPVLLWGLAAVLLVCAVILMFLRTRKDPTVPKEISVNNPEIEPLKKYFTVPVLMILLVVVIRSFYGKAVSYDWKTTFFISLAFSVCIVLGKALGGILADLIGVQVTSVISLGGAAVTVLFSEHSPVMGCISILLFNMTMPLTLTLLANYWKNNPGFAFGILMLALFIGTIPDLFGDGVSLPMWGLAIVSLIAMFCLLMGIKKKSG